MRSIYTKPGSFAHQLGRKAGKLEGSHRTKPEAPVFTGGATSLAMAKVLGQL